MFRHVQWRTCIIHDSPRTGACEGVERDAARSSPFHRRRCPAAHCGILVDTSTREVLSPHARQPRRVTPKAIAVLCALAETPGQVVGREELLARVWPDTLPTDDVLTQAVTQLRKAFGPQGRDCIETIAKGGYRLIVPVERLDAPASVAAATQAAPPASATPAATSPAPAGQPSLWKPALAAGLAVFAAGAAAWLLGHDATREAAQSTQGLPAAALERPYRVITTAPGFEMWPTLSPDASMVAYGAVAPGLSLLRSRSSRRRRWRPGR